MKQPVKKNTETKLTRRTLLILEIRVYESDRGGDLPKCRSKQNDFLPVL